MGKTPVKHTLAGYIIKKTDTEGYRSGKLTGEKHFNKITEMMEFVGGRRKLIDQARFIENNTQAGHDGKIRINWIQVNSDIKKIDCDVSSIPEMCRLFQRSEPAIRAWCREGKLPAYQLGGLWFANKADLLNLPKLTQ